MSQTIRRFVSSVPVDWDTQPQLEARPLGQGLVYYTTYHIGAIASRSVVGNAIVIPPYHIPVYAVFKAWFNGSVPTHGSDGESFYILMGWGDEQNNANDTSGVRWLAITPQHAFNNHIGYRPTTIQIASSSYLPVTADTMRVFEFVLPRLPVNPNDLYYFRIASSHTTSSTVQNAQLWVYCREAGV